MVKSNVTSRSNATANTSKKTHSATSSTSSKKKFVSPADSAAFAKHSDGQQCAGSKFFPQPLYDRMNQDLRLTYSVTCKRPWDIFSMLKLQNVQTLPEVITIEQVHQIIDTATTLRMKTYFWTVYSLGLRLNEGLHLQVGDIDAPRGMVRVHAPQYLRELEQSEANIQIRRVLQAIMQYSTGALGGVEWGCTRCGRFGAHVGTNNLGATLRQSKNPGEREKCWRRQAKSISPSFRQPLRLAYSTQF